MAGGRWQQAGGRWQVAAGRWQVAGGSRQVAAGRWQQAGGSRQVAAGSRQQAIRQAEETGRLERVPAYRVDGSYFAGVLVALSSLASAGGVPSVLPALSIREERIESTILLFESLKSIEMLKASQTVKRSHTLKLLLLTVIFSDCGNLRRISAAWACVLPALASKIASIFLFVIVINAPHKKQSVICLQV